MSKVGGLTPDNLAARDAICQIEAAHMVALAKGRASKSQGTALRATKRVKVEPDYDSLPPGDDGTFQHRPSPRASTSKTTIHSSTYPVKNDDEEEPEPEDDGSIKCICDETAEHGFMMECEQCGTWQHGSCLGVKLEKHLPPNYYCYVCKPEQFAKNPVTGKLELKAEYLVKPGGPSKRNGDSIFPAYDLNQIRTRLKHLAEGGGRPRGRPSKSKAEASDEEDYEEEQQSAQLAPNSDAGLRVFSRSLLTLPGSDRPDQEDSKSDGAFSAFDPIDLEMLRLPTPTDPSPSTSPVFASASLPEKYNERDLVPVSAVSLPGSTIVKIQISSASKPPSPIVETSASTFIPSDSNEADPHRLASQQSHADADNADTHGPQGGSATFEGVMSDSVQRLSPPIQSPSLANALGCEDCGNEKDLAWRTGPSGRKLLCVQCGDEWAKKKVVKLSMFDSSDEDEHEHEGMQIDTGDTTETPIATEALGVSTAAEGANENSTEAASETKISSAVSPYHLTSTANLAHQMTDPDWMQDVHVRSFLQPSLPAVQQRIRPQPKPKPTHSYSLLPLQESHEPFVIFLNKLNAGLGVAAPLLTSLGLKEEEDFHRIEPAWWEAFFDEQIRGKGLTSFDEFILFRRIKEYLADVEVARGK